MRAGDLRQAEHLHALGPGDRGMIWVVDRLGGRADQGAAKRHHEGEGDQGPQGRDEGQSGEPEGVDEAEGARRSSAPGWG